MLVISYNPGYQNFLKGLKPSTRQRFIALRFDFPRLPARRRSSPARPGWTPWTRGAWYPSPAPSAALKDVDLEEVASTRLLVYAATLIRDGMDPLQACRVSLVETLSDDPEINVALMEVVHATFGR